MTYNTVYLLAASIKFVFRNCISYSPIVLLSAITVNPALERERENRQGNMQNEELSVGGKEY